MVLNDPVPWEEAKKCLPAEITDEQLGLWRTVHGSIDKKFPRHSSQRRVEILKTIVKYAKPNYNAWKSKHYHFKWRSGGSTTKLSDAIMKAAEKLGVTMDGDQVRNSGAGSSKIVPATRTQNGTAFAVRIRKRGRPRPTASAAAPAAAPVPPAAPAAAPVPPAAPADAPVPPAAPAAAASLGRETSEQEGLAKRQKVALNSNGECRPAQRASGPSRLPAQQAPTQQAPTQKTTIDKVHDAVKLQQTKLSTVEHYEAQRQAG